MKGAIFDIDGTLLESLYVWHRVDEIFLNRRGFEVPPDYSEAVTSLGFRKTAEYTIERFGLSETPEALMDEWRELAKHEYEYHVPMKKDAEAFLRHLKQNGVALAVCTALVPELYVPALRRHGVYDCFDVFITADNSMAKSESTVFLKTAKMLGCAPGECIVFEDTVSCVVSAKKAGMITCGVYDEPVKKNETKMRELTDLYIRAYGEFDF